MGASTCSRNEIEDRGESVAAEREGLGGEVAIDRSTDCAAVEREILASHCNGIFSS
jgi:hypothetical protein